MLIPKCCKNCYGGRNGVCNCTLPSYCNEWVEDDGSEPVNYEMFVTTPNTAPLFWNVTQTDSSKNKDKIYVGDPYPCGVAFSGNEKKCPDCEQKDKRIAVLERALEIALEMTSCEYCPKDIAEKCDSWLGLGDGENCSETLKKYCIDEAEKELEEKK